MPFTRLGEGGYGVRRAGDFSGKTPSGGGGGGAHPVGVLTRFSPDGYGARRNGSFSGKTPSGGGGGGGSHPVGVLTRFGLEGYGVRRASFSAKTPATSTAGVVGLFAYWIGGAGAGSPTPTPTPTGQVDASGGGGSGSWRHYLGPARFKKYREKDHPDELRKRLREAFEQATGELSTLADRQEAIEILAPYVPALRDIAPRSLESIAPALPSINWDSVTKRITDGAADRLMAIEYRIEEEEHALMHLLLYG